MTASIVSFETFVGLQNGRISAAYVGVDQSICLTAIGGGCDRRLVMTNCRTGASHSLLAVATNLTRFNAHLQGFMS